MKTQIWIAVSSYLLIAIVKKRLQLDASMHTLLQICSLMPFEKMPVQQAFQPSANTPLGPNPLNQLILFDF